MKTKQDPDHRTYEPKHPEEVTSYDDCRPETDTPQKIRESEEATAEMERKGSRVRKDDGGPQQPG